MVTDLTTDNFDEIVLESDLPRPGRFLGPLVRTVQSSRPDR